MSKKILALVNNLFCTCSKTCYYIVVVILQAFFVYVVHPSNNWDKKKSQTNIFSRSWVLRSSLILPSLILHSCAVKRERIVRPGPVLMLSLIKMRVGRLGICWAANIAALEGPDQSPAHHELLLSWPWQLISQHKLKSTTRHIVWFWKYEKKSNLGRRPLKAKIQWFNFFPNVQQKDFYIYIFSLFFN